MDGSASTFLSLSLSLMCSNSQFPFRLREGEGIKDSQLLRIGIASIVHSVSVLLHLCTLRSYSLQARFRHLHLITINIHPPGPVDSLKGLNHEIQWSLIFSRTRLKRKWNMI
jgi:hypothetical protein